VAEGEAAADTDMRRALGPTVATASPGGGVWRRDWDAIPPTERREATPLAEGAMAGGVAGAKYLWEGIAKETTKRNEESISQKRQEAAWLAEWHLYSLTAVWAHHASEVVSFCSMAWWASSTFSSQPCFISFQFRYISGLFQMFLSVERLGDRCFLVSKD
jgi:hypothetical protein